MGPELESGSPVLLAGLLLSSGCPAREPRGSRCRLQGLLPQVGLLGQGLCLCSWFMGIHGGLCVRTGCADGSRPSSAYPGCLRGTRRLGEFGGPPDPDLGPLSCPEAWTCPSSCEEMRFLPCPSLCEPHTLLSQALPAQTQALDPTVSIICPI